METLVSVSWKLTCTCLTGARGWSVWTPGLCSEVFGGFSEMRTCACKCWASEAKTAISLGEQEFGSHHLFRRRAIEAEAVFWKHLVVCSTRCSWRLALGCGAGMRLSSQAWAWTSTGCLTVPPGDRLLLLILPSLGIFIVSSFELS